MISKCTYCGSISHGSGCRYSPNGNHLHPDDPTKCRFCGSTTRGRGCRYNPLTGLHVMGAGGGKCVYCGSKSNGRGCPLSPSGIHDKFGNSQAGDTHQEIGNNVRPQRGASPPDHPVVGADDLPVPMDAPHRIGRGSSLIAQTVEFFMERLWYVLLSAIAFVVVIPAILQIAFPNYEAYWCSIFTWFQKADLPYVHLSWRLAYLYILWLYGWLIYNGWTWDVDELAGRNKCWEQRIEAFPAVFQRVQNWTVIGAFIALYFPVWKMNKPVIGMPNLDWILVRIIVPLVSVLVLHGISDIKHICSSRFAMRTGGIGRPLWASICLFDGLLKLAVMSLLLNAIAWPVMYLVSILISRNGPAKT